MGLLPVIQVSRWAGNTKAALLRPETSVPWLSPWLILPPPVWAFRVVREGHHPSPVVLQLWDIGYAISLLQHQKYGDRLFPSELRNHNGQFLLPRRRPDRDLRHMLYNLGTWPVLGIIVAYNYRELAVMMTQERLTHISIWPYRCCGFDRKLRIIQYHSIDQI